MIEEVIAQTLGIGIEAAQGIIIIGQILGVLSSVAIVVSKILKKIGLNKDEIIETVNEKYSENKEAISDVKGCADVLQAKADSIKLELKDQSEDIKDIREKTQENSENIAKFSTALKMHLNQKEKD